jgi:hypothetical protein
LKKAVLDHQDLAVALDDLRLDLAHLFVEQHFIGQLAVENLLANLRHALGTERVGGARPAQRRLLLLIGLLEGLVAPFGREGWVGADAVQPLIDDPRALGRVDDGFLGILDCFGHNFAISSKKFSRQRRFLAWQDPWRPKTQGIHGYENPLLG